MTGLGPRGWRASSWRWALLLAVVEGQVVLPKGRIVSKVAHELLKAVHEMEGFWRHVSVTARPEGDAAFVQRMCDGGAAVTLAAGGGRTKSSRASLPKAAFLGDSFMVTDISINWACLLNSASKVCRKGLRDMGRLPALVGVCSEGEGIAGEPVLLRNGLLELRLSDRPGEERRSA